ncbi:cell number regulator 2-like [Asparagus officinalis]|nr:cell number regulator 2-like [Asparagus officinalis]
MAVTPAAWSTGLCDCCDDIGTCIITCFCPCITFGRVAEIIDRGTTTCEVSAVLYAIICCLTGCHWILSCFYRKKIRNIFFLEDSPCPDCLLHFCCDTCALCQEYRELKNRGLDANLGWKGKSDRETVIMAPPAVERDMVRENMQ